MKNQNLIFQPLKFILEIFIPHKKKNKKNQRIYKKKNLRKLNFRRKIDAIERNEINSMICILKMRPSHC